MGINIVNKKFATNKIINNNNELKISQQLASIVLDNDKIGKGTHGVEREVYADCPFGNNSEFCGWDFGSCQYTLSLYYIRSKV